MFLDSHLPAPPPGARMDFWTPENRQPEIVILLSRRIVAHHIHFDRRTIACPLELDQLGNVTVPCAMCSERKHPRRWRGYFHCYRPSQGNTAFLCIPPGTGAMLQETHGFDFDYRGLLAKVSRVAGAKNKPLIVAVDTMSKRRDQIPDEIDPAPFLDVVFRVKPKLP